MTSDITTLLSPVSGGRIRKSTATAIAAALTGLAVTGLTAMSVPASAAVAAHTYYVSPAGSDSNSGTSISAPWKSLAKASSVVLAPGDQLFFARGGSWTGRLDLTSSGTSASPISVNAYGTGPLPTFTVGTNGACVQVSGSYLQLQYLATDHCAYAGYVVAGHYDSINNSAASNSAVGIKINRGSAFGGFERDTLTNINVESTNTQGKYCGTPQATYKCNDDSGATAFLINGDDNDFGGNTITGSMAYSYDYGVDGSAFEIYDGNRNVFHDNTSTNNLVMSEIGRSSKGTANGNVYRANTVTTNCGTMCANSGGITLRGTGSMWGPNLSTVIDGNSFNLGGPNTKALSCYNGCPSSTVVTNNSFLASAHAVYMDATGWTFSNNLIKGATQLQLGTSNITVPAGTSIVR